MRGSAETISGVGSGATVSGQGVVTAWAPVDLDDSLGGPGSVNPLINVDGSCALDVEWPVEYGTGSAAGVAASDNLGVRSARKVDDVAGITPGQARSVRLNLSVASGADVELVRRALVQSRAGCLPTRARVPGIDPAIGDAGSAPRYRLMPRTLRVTRDASGITARIEGVELERVE